VEDGQVLLVGSRSGAMLALCFFALVFGGVAWALARALRNRGRSPQAVIWTALAVFGVPVALVYASSLNGFYEVEARASGVTLTHLLPSLRTYVDRAAVTRVDARPAYRGTWRVHIVLTSGEDRISAQTSKAVATTVAGELGRQLVPPPGARPNLAPE
jgi:hypothetical protein